MSGNFEVCPIGTLQRMAQVEAEVLSMRRCFEVTEQQRDRYKAERDALRAALEKIATVNAMDYEYVRWARAALRRDAAREGGGNV